MNIGLLWYVSPLRAQPIQSSFFVDNLLRFPFFLLLSNYLFSLMQLMLRYIPLVNNQNIKFLIYVKYSWTIVILYRVLVAVL